MTGQLREPTPPGSCPGPLGGRCRYSSISSAFEAPPPPACLLVCTVAPRRVLTLIHMRSQAAPSDGLNEVGTHAPCSGPLQRSRTSESLCRAHTGPGLGGDCSICLLPKAGCCLPPGCPARMGPVQGSDSTAPTTEGCPRKRRTEATHHGSR